MNLKFSKGFTSTRLVVHNRTNCFSLSTYSLPSLRVVVVYVSQTIRHPRVMYNNFLSYLLIETSSSPDWKYSTLTGNEYDTVIIVYWRNIRIKDSLNVFPILFLFWYLTKNRSLRFCFSFPLCYKSLDTFIEKKQDKVIPLLNTPRISQLK